MASLVRSRIREMSVGGPNISSFFRYGCTAVSRPSIRPIADARQTFFCLTNDNSIRQFSIASATKIATRGAASMLRERSVVYDPEELSLLGHILDQAIASLPAAMRTPYN